VAWLRLESSTSMMSRVFLVQRKNRKVTIKKKPRACFPTLDVGHPGPNSRKLPSSARDRRWKTSWKCSSILSSRRWKRNRCSNSCTVVPNRKANQILDDDVGQRCADDMIGMHSSQGEGKRQKNFWLVSDYEGRDISGDDHRQRRCTSVISRRALAYARICHPLRVPAWAPALTDPDRLPGPFSATPPPRRDRSPRDRRPVSALLHVAASS
jgi:hypothetical protein